MLVENSRGDFSIKASYLQYQSIWFPYSEMKQTSFAYFSYISIYCLSQFKHGAQLCRTNEGSENNIPVRPHAKLGAFI